MFLFLFFLPLNLPSESIYATHDQWSDRVTQYLLKSDYGLWVEGGQQNSCFGSLLNNGIIKHLIDCNETRFRWVWNEEMTIRFNSPRLFEMHRGSVCNTR